MAKLLLGHFDLVVEGIDSEEGDSLLDELGNLHELVLGPLLVKLLGHNQVVEDVCLVLDVEILVLVPVVLLQVEKFFLLVVEKLVKVHVFVLVGVFSLEVVVLGVKDTDQSVNHQLVLLELIFLFKVDILLSKLVSLMEVFILASSFVMVAILAMIMVQILVSMMCIVNDFLLFLNNLFVELEFPAINLDVVGPLLLLVLLLDDKDKVHDEKHDDVNSKRAKGCSDCTSHSSDVSQQVLDREVLVLEHLFGKRETEVQVDWKTLKVVNLILVKLETHSDVVFW